MGKYVSRSKNKKLTQRRMQRRALATVVTTVIIMSSVSIIGVFSLGWSNAHMQNQKEEIEELFNTKVNKMHEDVLFENVLFNTSPSKQLNFTLTNNGIIGLNITEIKLQNPSTLADLATFSYSDGGITPSSSFSKNATYSWSSSEEINIIATTERGNQFITQVVAP